ncbi:hypothetical protein LRU_00145 [Ligilactobacillus ruminis SPM0211]|uniref:Uncharacterized protein n=1 Tax=Ligilactobacillus ruminis SPM0211 TaxID=1040964 RepID=F7QXJ0_9LACO|nr:hypothetical protein LRU_00145 [Ligilactobacillus ruminis SPM0211]
MHQLAVADAVHTSCSVDTSNPQLAEVGLVLSTITESVLV